MGFLNKLGSGLSDAVASAKSGFGKTVGAIGEATGSEDLQSLGRVSQGLESVEDIKNKVKYSSNKQQVADMVNVAREGYKNSATEKVALDILKEQYGSDTYNRAKEVGVEAAIGAEQSKYLLKYVNNSMIDAAKEVSEPTKSYYESQDEKFINNYFNMLHQQMGDAEWGKYLNTNKQAADWMIRQQKKESSYSPTRWYDVANSFVTQITEPTDMWATMLSMSGQDQKTKNKIAGEYYDRYGYEKPVDGNISSGQFLSNYAVHGGIMDAIPVVGIGFKGAKTLLKSGGYIKDMSRVAEAVKNLNRVDDVISNIKTDAALSRYLKTNNISINAKNLDKIIEQAGKSSSFGSDLIKHFDVDNLGGGFNKKFKVGALDVNQSTIGNKLKAGIETDLAGGKYNYAMKELSHMPGELLGLDKGSRKFLGYTHAAAGVSAAVTGRDNFITNAALNPLDPIIEGLGSAGIIGSVSSREHSKNIVDPQWKSTYGTIPQPGDLLYESYNEKIEQQHKYLTPYQKIWGMPDTTWGKWGAAMFDMVGTLGVMKGAGIAVKVGGDISGLNKVIPGIVDKINFGDYVDEEGNLKVGVLDKVEKSKDKEAALQGLLQVIKKDPSSIKIWDKAKIIKMLDETHNIFLQQAESAKGDNKEISELLTKKLKEVASVDGQDSEAAAQRDRLLVEIADLNQQLHVSNAEYMKATNIVPDIEKTMFRFKMGMDVMNTLREHHDFKDNFVNRNLSKFSSNHKTYAGLLGQTHFEHLKAMGTEMLARYKGTVESMKQMQLSAPVMNDLFRLSPMIEDKIHTFISSEIAKYPKEIAKEYETNITNSVRDAIHYSIINDYGSAKRTNVDRYVDGKVSDILRNVFTPKEGANVFDRLIGVKKRLRDMDSKAIKELSVKMGIDKQTLLNDLLLGFVDGGITGTTKVSPITKIVTSLGKKLAGNTSLQDILKSPIKRKIFEGILGGYKSPAVGQILDKVSLVLDTIDKYNNTVKTGLKIPLDNVLNFVFNKLDAKHGFDINALPGPMRSVVGDAIKYIDGIAKNIDGAGITTKMLHSVLRGRIGKTNFDFSKTFDYITSFGNKSIGKMLGDIEVGFDKVQGDLIDVLRKVLDNSADVIKDLDENVISKLGKKNFLLKYGVKKGKDFIDNLIEDTVKELADVDVDVVVKKGQYEATFTKDQIVGMVQQISHLSSIKNSLAVLDIGSDYLSGTKGDNAFLDLIGPMDQANLKQYLVDNLEFLDSGKIVLGAKEGEGDATVRTHALRSSLTRALATLGDSELEHLSESQFGIVMKDLMAVDAMIGPQMKGLSGTTQRAISGFKKLVSSVENVIENITTDKAITEIYRRGDLMMDQISKMQKVNADTDARTDNHNYSETAMITKNLIDYLYNGDNRKPVAQTINRVFPGVELEPGSSSWMQGVKFSTENIEKLANKHDTYEGFVDAFFNETIYKGIPGFKQHPMASQKLYEALMNTDDFGFNDKTKLVFHQLQTKYNMISDKFGGKGIDRNFGKKTIFHDVTGEYGKRNDMFDMKTYYENTRKEYQSDIGKISEFENSLGVDNTAIQYYKSNYNVPQKVGATDIKGIDTDDLFKMSMGKESGYTSDMNKDIYEDIQKHMFDVEDSTDSYFFFSASAGDNAILIKKDIINKELSKFLGEKYSIEINKISGTDKPGGLKYELAKGYALLKGMGMLDNPEVAANRQKEFQSSISSKGDIDTLIGGFGYNTHKYFPKISNPYLKVTGADVDNYYKEKNITTYIDDEGKPRPVYTGYDVILIKDTKSTLGAGHDESSDATYLDFGSTSSLVGGLSSHMEHGVDYQTKKINHSYDGGILKSKQELATPKALASRMFFDGHEYGTFRSLAEGISLIRNKMGDPISVEDIYTRVGYDIDKGFVGSESFSLLTNFLKRQVDNGSLKGAAYESTMKHFGKDIVTGRNADGSAIKTSLINRGLSVPKPERVVNIKASTVYGATNAIPRDNYYKGTQTLTQQFIQNQSVEGRKALFVGLRSLEDDLTNGRGEYIDVARRIEGHIINNEITEANELFKNVFSKMLDAGSDLMVGIKEEYAGVDKFTPEQLMRLVGSIKEAHSVKRVIPGYSGDIQSVGDSTLIKLVEDAGLVMGEGDNFVVTSRKHAGKNHKFKVKTSMDNSAISDAAIVNSKTKGWENGDAVVFMRNPNSGAKTGRGVRVIFIEDIKSDELRAQFLGVNSKATNQIYISGGITKLINGDYDGDQGVLFFDLARQPSHVDGMSVGDVLLKYTEDSDARATPDVGKSDFFEAPDGYGKATKKAWVNIGGIKMSHVKGGVSSAATHARGINTLSVANFMHGNFATGEGVDIAQVKATHKEANIKGSVAIEEAVDGVLGKKGEAELANMYKQFLNMYPHWKASIAGEVKAGKLTPQGEQSLMSFINFIDNYHQTNGFHEIFRQKYEGRPVGLDARVVFTKNQQTALDFTAVSKAADSILRTMPSKMSFKEQQLVRTGVYRDYMVARLTRLLNGTDPEFVKSAVENTNGAIASEGFKSLKQLYLGKRYNHAKATEVLSTAITKLNEATTVGDVRSVMKDIVGSFKKNKQYVRDLPFDVRNSRQPTKVLTKQGRPVKDKHGNPAMTKDERFNPFYDGLKNDDVIIEYENNNGDKIKTSEDYLMYERAVHTDPALLANKSEADATYLATSGMTSSMANFNGARSAIFLGKVKMTNGKVTEKYSDVLNEVKGKKPWLELEEAGVFNEDLVQIRSNNDIKGGDLIIEKFKEPELTHREKRAVAAYLFSFYGPTNMGKDLVHWLVHNGYKTEYVRSIKFNTSKVGDKSIHSYVAGDIKKLMDDDEYNSLLKLIPKEEIPKFIAAKYSGDTKLYDKYKKDVFDVSPERIMNEKVKEIGTYGQGAVIDTYRQGIKRIATDGVIKKNVSREYGDKILGAKDVELLITKFATEAHGSLMKTMREMHGYYKNRAQVNEHTQYFNLGYQLVNSLSKLSVDSTTKFDEAMTKDPLIKGILDHIFSNVKDNKDFDALSKDAKWLIIKEVSILAKDQQKASLLQTMSKDNAEKTLSILGKSYDKTISPVNKKINQLYAGLSKARGENKAMELRKSAAKLNSNIAKTISNSDSVRKQTTIYFGEIMRSNPNMPASEAHNLAIKKVFAGFGKNKEGDTSNFTNAERQEMSTHIKTFHSEVGGIVKGYISSTAEIATKLANFGQFADESMQYHTKKLNDMILKNALANTTTSERWIDGVIGNLNNIYKGLSLGMAGGRILMEGANASTSRLVNRVSSGRILSKKGLAKELGVKTDDINLEKDSMFRNISWSHREELMGKAFNEYNKLADEGATAVLRRLNRFIGDTSSIIADHSYEWITKKIRDKYFIDETYDSIYGLVRSKIAKSDDTKAATDLYRRLLTSKKLTTNEKVKKNNLLNEAVRKSSKITRENFFDYKDNPLWATNVEKYIPFFNFAYNNMKIISKNPNSWLTTFAMLNQVSNNLQPVTYVMNEEQFKGYFETGGLGGRLLGLLGFGSMNTDLKRISPVALALPHSGYAYQQMMMPTTDKDYQSLLDGDIKRGAVGYLIKKIAPPLYDLALGDSRAMMGRLTYMGSGFAIKDNSLKEFMSDYYGGNYDDASKYNKLVLKKYNEWRQSHNPDAKPITKNTIKALAHLDKVMEWDQEKGEEYYKKKMFPDVAAVELGVNLDATPEQREKRNYMMKQVYGKYVESHTEGDFNSEQYLAQLKELNDAGVWDELIKADVMTDYAISSKYRADNVDMLSQYYYEPWDSIIKSNGDDDGVTHQQTYESIIKNLSFCYKFEGEASALLSKAEQDVYNNSDKTVEELLGNTEYLNRKVKAVKEGLLVRPVVVDDKSLVDGDNGLTSLYNTYLETTKGEMVASYEASLGRTRSTASLKQMWVNQALIQKEDGNSGAESFAWDMVKEYKAMEADEASKMLRYDPFWYKTVLELKKLNAGSISNDGLLSAMFGAKDTYKKNYYNRSSDYYAKKEDYFKSQSKREGAAEEAEYWTKYGTSLNTMAYINGQQKGGGGGTFEGLSLNF